VTGAIVIYGQGGNDALPAQYLSNVAVRVFGDAGDDQIIGGAMADTLYGGSGNDQIWGADPTQINNETDDDLIYGEDGNDVLIGWAGSDTIFGGGGEDMLWGGGLEFQNSTIEDLYDMHSVWSAGGLFSVRRQDLMDDVVTNLNLGEEGDITLITDFLTDHLYGFVIDDDTDEALDWLIWHFNGGSGVADVIESAFEVVGSDDEDDYDSPLSF